jgi:putative lipoic acid-binding regulatory protein
MSASIHFPTDSAASASERKDSLIDYPSAFPIKIMGLAHEDFVHAITHLARTFDPFFDAASIELRTSSGGKYLGITITVTATSREQLDGLYIALSSHPMVKVVL